MTSTIIKPLTPLMTAMLVSVAEKGRAVATGRDLITMRGLVARGLVEIISREDKLFGKAGETLVYTTTDPGFALAVELV